jgi:hypothetical protein
MASDDGGAEQGAVVGGDELLEKASSLLEQAGALKAHYRELSERLDGLHADEPVRVGGGEGDARPVEQEMRAAAANLFLTGSSPEEVARYLEETFGRTDTQPLLDEVQVESARRPRRPRFRRGA